MASTGCLRSSLIALTGTWLMLCSGAGAATPEQIDAAIERAKQYLYSHQTPAGHWESADAPDPLAKDAANSVTAGNYGGMTAAATFALLAARENAQLPQLAKAIDFLTRVDSVCPYSLGLRCQVWGMAPRSAKNLEAFRRDQQIILKMLRTRGAARGLYHYTYLPASDDYDHSVSQFGVLGAWACMDSDLEIPAAYWSEVDTAWRNHQYSDGSWSYTYGYTGGRKPPEAASPPKQENSTIAMTAAGVATLFLTRDIGRASEGIDCRGNVVDPNIDMGLQWIGKHFTAAYDANQHLNAMSLQYYVLFGISRIGVASGYKYMGTIDWFQNGADYILQNQSPDGSWNGHGGDVVNTAFGILFLVRGRAPVAFNKLQYETETKGTVAPGNWCQRPRDIANLTRWIGRQAEHDLNWQVVTLKTPLEEIQEAPILYISGNQPLSFPDPQGTEARLRQYVEEGGMILFNADCGDEKFTKSATKLAARLFPQYEFRPLPENHPIYVNQVYPREKWKNKPRVMGLSNGVRELMLMLPQSDPARYWQFRGNNREDALRLGADIYQYATDKQIPRSKGMTHLVRADAGAAGAGSLRIYRLKYSGNWDPEPAGWRRLSALLRQQNGNGLDIQAIELGKGELKLDRKLAHLTGTSGLTLSEAQRAELKAFVTGGGTLVIDSAGGAAEFSTAIEKELAAIFPDQAKQLNNTLPDDHPAFTAGGKMEIGYRDYSRKRTVGSLKSIRIKGIEMEGRLAVFFSPEDLSEGLVGQQVDGIIGYAPGTATSIMSRIVQYANAPGGR